MEVQPSAQSSSQKENFVNTSKRFLENTNRTFPVSRVFLKYFVRACRIKTRQVKFPHIMGLGVITEAATKDVR